MNLDEWKSQIKRGILEYCVLLTIRKRPTYGYDWMSLFQEHSMISASESTIYPLLRRLMKADYLSSYWERTEDGLPPRKYYTLTEKGAHHLEAMSGSWIELVNAVETIRSDEHGSKTDPLSDNM